MIKVLDKRFTTKLINFLTERKKDSFFLFKINEVFTIVLPMLSSFCFLIIFVIFSFLEAESEFEPLPPPNEANTLPLHPGIALL